MIRTVFFGTPDFAVTCLEALIIAESIDVCAVVTAPDRPSGRGQHLNPSAVAQYAMAKGLPLLRPERLRNEDFIDELSQFGADVFTVVAFRMLPEVVWSMPQRGSLNIHASLLPDLRGAAPIQWSLAYGDRQTGLTAFSLTHAIDRGPLLEQVVMEIGPNETLGQLYPRMASAGAQLAVKVLTRMDQGTLAGRPQLDRVDLRAAPKIGPDFSQLESISSVCGIHHRIRACDPTPGASLPSPEDQCVRIKLFQSQFHAGPGEVSRSEIYYIIDNESIKIIGGDGMLLVHEVQWAGKRRMPTREFLRGARIRGTFSLAGSKID